MMREFQVLSVTRSPSGKRSHYKIKTGFILEVQDADADIQFGSFLAKYGSTILQHFHEGGKGKEWRAEPFSFPMKLSVKSRREFHDFNAANSRGKTMRVFFDDAKSVFLLEKIPTGDEASFKQNVIYDILDSDDRSAHSPPNMRGKDYTNGEEDESKVLNVSIILLVTSDLEDGELEASFSFLKADVTHISYGAFLSAYGADILAAFNDITGIPEYTKGDPFPMELKFHEVFDLGEVFHNDNRDNTLHWDEDDVNVLFLRLLSEREHGDFDANVADLSEDPPECIICFGELHKPVFAFDPSAGVERVYTALPNIPDTMDVTKLPCGHTFHTHCILKSCSHNFYKCTRCTKNPGVFWWKDRLYMVLRNLYICRLDLAKGIRLLETELEKKTEELAKLRATFALDTKRLKDEINASSLETELETKTRELEKLRATSALDTQKLEDEINAINTKMTTNKLINDTINGEIQFIKKTQQPDSTWFRSRLRFQQDNMANLNGFQRLNLLLERHM